MRKVSYIIVACMVMTACSNERLYQTLGSPDPQGPPTIYPLNFPLCSHDWGMVIIPLGIVVYRDTVPNAEHIMHLIKKFPERSPCEIIREDSIRNSHHIERRDNFNRVARLDKSGRGYSYSSHYHFNLMNHETSQDNERIQRAYEKIQLNNLIRDGYARKEFVESEDILTINGMEWRHQVVGKYRTTSFDPDHPRDMSNLEDLSDVYEHRFDESHIFQIKGQYDKTILSYPELSEDRRRMTRRLVEGFRYEFLTPEQIELIDGPRG